MMTIATVAAAAARVEASASSPSPKPQKEAEPQAEVEEKQEEKEDEQRDKEVDLTTEQQAPPSAPAPAASQKKPSPPSGPLTPEQKAPALAAALKKPPPPSGPSDEVRRCVKCSFACGVTTASETHVQLEPCGCIMCKDCMLALLSQTRLRPWVQCPRREGCGKHVFGHGLYRLQVDKVKEDEKKNNKKDGKTNNDSESSQEGKVKEQGKKEVKKFVMIYREVYPPVPSYPIPPLPPPPPPVQGIQTIAPQATVAGQRKKRKRETSSQAPVASPVAPTAKKSLGTSFEPEEVTTKRGASLAAAAVRKRRNEVNVDAVSAYAQRKSEEKAARFPHAKPTRHHKDHFDEDVQGVYTQGLQMEISEQKRRKQAELEELRRHNLAMEEIEKSKLDNLSPQAILDYKIYCMKKAMELLESGFSENYIKKVAPELETYLDES